ncbi:helix-turn-helix transcriptional regulator [Glycomyces tenuis]|uniref:helix-turn-helix transcriptional regulator n=1 Tax=Glycomyces tenuis TaxID=58116 RepID=UPI0009DF975F|nr:helix-turn-helix transcriptional regulator [Glycomyces tenuis]
MNRAGLLCLRRSLGLTVTSLAAAIGVTRRTVTRWEAGEPIYRLNAEALADLVAYTDQTVADLAAVHGPENPIVTYLTDESYRASRPERVVSAEWHQLVAWRAAEECGARIIYPET